MPYTITWRDKGIELTRIYGKYITEKSAWDTAIFQNLEDAEVWLGLHD